MNPINYAYEGHESFTTFALETNAPPLPNATTVPVAPALADHKLLGWGQSGSLEFDTGTQLIDAAPAYQDVDIVQTTNHITSSGEITLAASDQEVSIVDLAFRNSGVEADQTVLCLPTFALGWGYLAGCEAGRGLTYIGRHCLINQFSMTAGEGQPVRATYDIWAHYLQTSGTLLTDAVGENEDGDSIFYESLRWDSVDVTLGGNSWRDNIISVNLGVNNNLKRKGVRKLQTGGGAALSLTPVWIQPGKQVTSLSMQFNTPIPDALRRGEIGPIVLTASGYYASTPKTLTITIGNAQFAQGGRGAIGAGDSAVYNATFSPRNVSAVWS